MYRQIGKTEGVDFWGLRQAFPGIMFPDIGPNDEWLADNGMERYEPEVQVYVPTYQDLRAAEYPSIQEQLDMQYWDAVNGTTTWLDLVSNIKEKYPKV